jgi:O-antigen ligase/polysaccharide polymerase Wzy-like membrane protein
MTDEARIYRTQPLPWVLVAPEWPHYRGEEIKGLKMIALVLLSGSIWLLILFHQIAHRGFLVLIIWLLIAPVATNFVSSPGRNPFFNPQKAQKLKDDVQRRHRDAFLRPENNPIRINQVFEPTRTLLGGFVVSLIFQTFLKKKRLGPFDSIEIWMGIFSFILIVSIFFHSARLHYSIRVASDAFIFPFFAYFITRRLVTSESRFHQLNRAMNYIGFYLILIGLLEALVQQSLLYPISGPFQTTTSYFAVMMVVFFSVLLDTIYHRKFCWVKGSPSFGGRELVLVMIPLIIFLTFSRGIWIGFLTGIWIFVFMARRKISFPQKLGAIGLALMTIPLIIIALAILIPIELMQTQIGNTDTIYGRIAAWLIALEKGVEHPLTGIGLNNLRYVLHETRLLFNGVRNLGSVHNSFLAIFAEQGLVGLIAYLALIVSIVRKGLSLYRADTDSPSQWRGITVIAIMTAYHTPALFASTLHDHNILAHLYVYVFIGAIAGLRSQSQSIPNHSMPVKQHQWTNRAAPVHV